MTLAEAQARVAEISDILATGIEEVSTAAGSRKNNLAELRRERDRLLAEINAATAPRVRRGRWT